MSKLQPAKVSKVETVERRAERISLRRAQKVEQWYQQVKMGMGADVNPENIEAAFDALEHLTALANTGLLAVEFRHAVGTLIPKELA